MTRREPVASRSESSGTPEVVGGGPEHAHGAPSYRVELTIGGTTVHLPISRLEVLLAADRADRLEIDLVVAPGHFGGGLERLRLRPGLPVGLQVGGLLLFCGSVERWLWRRDLVAGSACRLVSYSTYQSSRARSAPRRYYQVTSSDVAEEVARELELVAEVERTESVHARLDCVGDPLRFLRERACEEGFELAVVDGTLYFVSELPVESGAMAAVPGTVVGLQLEQPSRGRIDGVMELWGDPRWRPLVQCDVASVISPGGLDERVVAWRCAHRFSADGYRTFVEFRVRGTRSREDAA